MWNFVLYFIHWRSSAAQFRTMYVDPNKEKFNARVNDFVRVMHGGEEWKANVTLSLAWEVAKESPEVSDPKLTMV